MNAKNKEEKLSALISDFVKPIPIKIGHMDSTRLLAGSGISPGHESTYTTCFEGQIEPDNGSPKNKYNKTILCPYCKDEIEIEIRQARGVIIRPEDIENDPDLLVELRKTARTQSIIIGLAVGFCIALCVHIFNMIDSSRVADVTDAVLLMLIVSITAGILLFWYKLKRLPKKYTLVDLSKAKEFDDYPNLREDCYINLISKIHLINEGKRHIFLDQPFLGWEKMPLVAGIEGLRVKINHLNNGLLK